MRKRRRSDLVAIAVLVLSAAGAINALRAIDRIPRQTVAQEALYISSPDALRRMSLGYTGLLADIYWTRAVQYFGDQHHSASRDFRLLAPLLQVTTELDPRLFPAYEFGANFLAPKPPGGAGLPGAAIALLQYGVEHNPDQWRLYYNLGFVYYTELKDFPHAAQAFAAGAKLPGTSAFMPILAAQMAGHAGEFDTARMLWRTTYQTAKEPVIRENAALHLVALQVDEEVTRLDHAVDTYEDRTGRLPASMSDLERAGLIDGIPVDPTGQPYKLMSDGRIEVQSPKSLYFITKGLPPGMETPLPPVHRTASTK